MSFPAPSRLRLDGEALVNNWKAMARLSGIAGTGAAVKADAYGLGARHVVPRLWEAGCRDFFVAHWAEAEAIADLIPPSNISVLNGVNADEFALARSMGAVPVLNTPGQIMAWRNAGGGRCHVMVDSGMNRLGLGPEQVSAQLFDGLEVDILMSHLASADEDVEQNAMQLGRFKELSSAISAERKSLANSAGVVLGPDYHFDLTRPGIALYGAAVVENLAEAIHAVVRIEARILQVRHLGAGEPVGYNASWQTQQPTTLITVAYGYADGYARAFANCGTVIVNGHICPVVGRVSMDLITIAVGKDQAPEEGDWVEIGFDLQAASQASGISPYELLTKLGNRSERLWA
ncbi:MAG: alanine racemase [Sphingomonadales bacterium]|nr:alanine racemase [Sphingomonadales bacterium]MBK9003627.1 alanine racemase [Sphingomonadales bacterium]MBK9268802.1 alanine racemase [Sphingomonadales bacterium]MBP6433624.1 alanine racemase [Sphingorhabdus sp.]